MLWTFLLACAPADRPSWSPSTQINPIGWTGAGAPADEGGGDSADTAGATDPAADTACVDFEGTWAFTLTVLAGECAIPTPLAFSQSMRCTGADTFTFSYGGFDQACALEGASFGCHTPDPTYSFALGGSFAGDEASGTWTWRFPSNCESVSGTFAATR